MKLLTIFTPTYNRKHTIVRTYESLLRQTCKDFCWLIIDDGSSDGTKEWVLSLGESLELRAERFDWMGRLVEAGSPELRNCGTSEGGDSGTMELNLKPETSEMSKEKTSEIPRFRSSEIPNSHSVNPEIRSSVDPNSHFVIHVPFSDNEGTLRIEYIYKPNGGLYTGYNVAFATAKTELCVCIDSDDFMPDDAVENICKICGSMSLDEKTKIGGIAGLDYDVTNGQPLGGMFPVDNNVAWIQDLHHTADSKYVFRTAEISKYAPQIGFEGEKDYNPHYMQIRLFDLLPMYVVNKNLCWVEYQIGADSMSQAIWKQYVRSPRSYARYRINQMTLKHGNPLKNKFRLCIHYISSCILSKDKDWLKNSPLKLLTILAIPLGVVLFFLILFKSRK